MGKDRIESAKLGRAANGARPGGGSDSRFGKVAGGSASYRRVPNIGGVLDAIAFAGDALTCGRTSDGGTCSLTLLYEDARGKHQDKAYAHSQEELDEYFAGLAAFYIPSRPIPAAADPPPATDPAK